MKKSIVFIMLIILPSGVLGNPITLPKLPAIDYFRSTAGERLFFCYQELHKGSFYIDNDFRLYNSNKYWNNSGKKYDHSKHTRLINIISIKYSPISKTQFSIRVPYVYLNNQLQKYGLSDIFLGVSYEITQFLNNKIYLSSGVKIPTGYYDEYDEEKLPLGTGSFDIPFILNSDLNIKNNLLFFDVGYIFIGDSKVSHKKILPPYHPPYNIVLEGAKRNNGDEIFCDIAIIKRLEEVAFKFEMNYYYVFDSSISGKPRSNDSHSKFSVTPGLIFSPKFKNIKLEFGFSYDLAGKNNFSGYSPVIRIHYNK